MTAFGKVIDISLTLDAESFHMRTPAGFKRDMQFELEVLKEHDAPGGAGQIVRGVHMRLHAGSHIDAPEHNVKGGAQVLDLPIETFIGPAVVADLRHTFPGKAITAEELRRAVGSVIQHGDHLLMRTDANKNYDGSPAWMKSCPYLTRDAVEWCVEGGVKIIGYDFYHGADAPDAPRTFDTARLLNEKGIITLTYLQNLDQITKPRVTLLAFPLKIAGAEASPVRAVVLED
ncbi:MAG TPA: cyclase family protein [Candidatus Binatia bacterium]|nr:cyclase family protein [Candidatus Binatia bacterium]